MLIWILTFVLLGLLGALGFYQGAIRALISLFGVIVGAALALPLSPWVAPLVPKVGLENIVWKWVLPPVVVFLVVSILFTVVGILVHAKVAQYVSNRSDDFDHFRWARLNKRLGVCFGLVTGAAYLILIGWGVYLMGYVTVQVESSSDPAALSFVNKARRDMERTGLDKIIAGFEPGSDLYYRASDVVGLVYQNPLLHGRLADYPPFISIGQKNVFEEIATEPAVIDKLQSQANLFELVNESAIQSMLEDEQFRERLAQVDFEDLREYLKTGKSPKYFDEKLIGEWELDTDTLIAMVLRRKSDLTAADFISLKRIAPLLAGITFTATVDNRVALNFDMPAQEAQEPEPEELDPYAEAYGVDPSTANRYGVPSRAPRQAQREATPAPKPSEQYSLAMSGTGKWEPHGRDYRVTLTDSTGKRHELSAEADDELLVLSDGSDLLAFLRAE